MNLSPEAQDTLRRYRLTLAEFPHAPLVRTKRGDEWPEILELLKAGIITPEINADGSPKVSTKDGEMIGGIFTMKVQP